MISNRTAVQTLSRSSASYTPTFTRGREWVATLPRVARSVTSVVVSFAKIPLLPVAALWEASVVVGLVNGADHGNSDSLPTYTSIRTDDAFLWRF
jgi:hypothetical protein